MGAFDISCQTAKKNTGLHTLCQDIGIFQSYIIAPYDFEMTAADAADRTKWEEAINAMPGVRVYPFPLIHNHTDESEDDPIDEGTLSEIVLRDGKIRYTFTHDSSRYKHEALKSHSGQSVSIHFVDAQNRLHGIRSGANYRGIPLSKFHVGRLSLNDGSAEGAKTTVQITLADPISYQSLPAVVETDFAKDLRGLIDLNVELVSATTSAITLKVTHNRTSRGFQGEVADFVLKDADGAAQTITSVTSEADGTNVLNFTTPLAAGVYTANLGDPWDTENGFESVGSVEVDLSE